MENRRPVGWLLTLLGLLVACTLSYTALAGPDDEEHAPEFRFRDTTGERVVPMDQLYFHIHTVPSRWSRYSRKSVFDPDTDQRVKFREMASFTVTSGPDGHKVTFKMPGEKKAKTLPFDGSEEFHGDEFIPRMLIKRRGQAAVNHEYIKLEEIEWPIVIKR